MRNLDAPLVAVPVARSTNVTTQVPVIAVDIPFEVLGPSKNDVTPASSMSDDDDFGSEDGTEDTVTQLIAKASFHLGLEQNMTGARLSETRTGNNKLS